MEKTPGKQCNVMQCYTDPALTLYAKYTNRIIQSENAALTREKHHQRQMKKIDTTSFNSDRPQWEVQTMDCKERSTNQPLKQSYVERIREFCTCPEPNPLCPESLRYSCHTHWLPAMPTPALRLQNQQE